MLERGQRRLPQADAAIVGRDTGVGPDPNALRFEHRFRVFEQHLILEDSAREHNGACAVTLAKHLNGGAHAPRDTTLKGASDDSGFLASLAILNNSREQRTKVE